MKLFTRYNRINLTSTIVIFLLASVAFYFLINYIIISQVDNDLAIERTEIMNYVHEHGFLQEATNVKDQRIAYQTGSQPYKGATFRTVTLYDSTEKEDGAFRQVVFGVAAAGENYRVTVTKSLEEIDDLINSILYISLSTILLILAASFLINRLILKRLWKPFYETLDRFRTFTLRKMETIHFPPTPIDEFSFMNATLAGTTSKAQQDYLILKEFTENASHEMQTPLAIIRSRLDMLLQEESLSSAQGKILEGAYDAVQKLSRLSQSLLLLAKIENKQFSETETIDLKEKILQKKEALRELYEHRQITVDTSLQPATIAMSPILCDVLLNNLFSNSIRHNYTGGNIQVLLNAGRLNIINTGSPPALDAARLFSRFYKSSGNPESNGLGLSLIKQICDVSGFAVSYAFENDRHSFSITWQ